MTALKPSTVAGINALESAIVQDALTRSCDLCQAPKDQICHDPISGGPMPDRQVHFGRLIDRRREPKEKA